jgi:hypothetical protein
VFSSFVLSQSVSTEQSDKETEMEPENKPLIDDLDQLRTFKDTAAALRIPYFKVQRAARAGIIPTYRLLNSRKYVKLRDILALMSAG